MLDIEAIPDDLDSSEAASRKREAEAEYEAEYLARVEAGEPNRIDHANAAVETALIAHGRIAGDHDGAERRLIADATLAFKRVREAASLVARFERAEREAEAEAALAFVLAEVARLRELDPAKFAPGKWKGADGIVPVFADGRANVSHDRK